MKNFCYAILANNLVDLKQGQQIFVLSEISNMKGHYVFMDASNVEGVSQKIYQGYHEDNFIFYTNQHYGGYCLSDFFKSINYKWYAPEILFDFYNDEDPFWEKNLILQLKKQHENNNI